MEITTRDNGLSTSGSSGNHADTLGKASSMAHAAVNSIAATADEAVLKAKPAIDQVAALANDTVDRAAGAAAPTAEWLVAKGESLKAAQKKVVEGTYQYVSKNPIKSIGIAVIAGFLLSRISRIVYK